MSDKNREHLVDIAICRLSNLQHTPIIHSVLTMTASISHACNDVADKIQEAKSPLFYADTKPPGRDARPTDKHAAQ